MPVLHFAADAEQPIEGAFRAFSRDAEVPAFPAQGDTADEGAVFVPPGPPGAVALRLPGADLAAGTEADRDRSDRAEVGAQPPVRQRSSEVRAVVGQGDG